MFVNNQLYLIVLNINKVQMFRLVWNVEISHILRMEVVILEKLLAAKLIQQKLNVTSVTKITN